MFGFCASQTDIEIESTLQPKDCIKTMAFYQTPPWITSKYFLVDPSCILFHLEGFGVYLILTHTHLDYMLLQAQVERVHQVSGGWERAASGTSWFTWTDGWMDMVGMTAILKEMDMIDMMNMIKKIQWKLLIQYVINAWKCWIPKIYKMCSKLHKSIHYTDAWNPAAVRIN